MVERLLTLSSMEKVTPTVFRATLTGEIPAFRAGQFLHVEVPHFTLRRPFCITAGGENSVTVVFAVVGAGTLALSNLSIGTALHCILPIGNGFDLPSSARRILIVGGGLGVAPLLPILSQNPDREFCVLLGYGSAAAAVELQEFYAYTKNVQIATDDGSLGHCGRVTDLVKDALESFKPDLACVCGPTPMLRAAKEIDFSCPVQVSLEARMGCGVGACLVCTCPVQKGETVKNLRVCVDGPVFDLCDVKL